MVSYIIVTHNRKKMLREAVLSVLFQTYSPLEIVIVDNGSTDGTEELFQEEFNKLNFKYIRFDRNLGAAEGRNVAIREARGEIIIGIDSDTEIYEKNATQKIVDKFRKDKTIGLLAFKVLNYYTKKIQKSAFPTRNYIKHSPEKEFQTSWFIGMAYAVPKSVYDESGLFRDFSSYGHEELDLAYRIMDKNFKIIYYPEVTVLHKINKKRAERLKGKWEFILKNRIKATVLNLPYIYAISVGFLWTVKIFLDSKGDTISLFKAWQRLFSERALLKKERKVISKSTIRRISSLNGPLWY